MVRGYIYATGVLIKKYRTLVKIEVKHISREIELLREKS